MQFNNELHRAFCENNLWKFTEILEVYEADPNSYPNHSCETNFEIILKTPGSSRFIAKCIEYGADFNVKHPIKNGINTEFIYPLHHVIESESIENLKAIEDLLQISNTKDGSYSQSPYVNVKDANGKNSLHILIEKIEDKNYNALFPMIKLLMSYGCNPNSRDNHGKTPFSILVDKHQKMKNGIELLKYFREHANIERKKSCKGKEENLNICDFNLIELLQNGNINKFEEKFQKLKGNEENYKADCESYLKIAIESKFINIIDQIVNIASLKKIYDLEIEENNTKIPILFWAYKEADLEILSTLISHSHIKLHHEHSTLLHYFFNKFKTANCENSKELIDYEWKNDMTINEIKCFELLLKISRFDGDFINELDENGHPAIYYSVKYGIDYITKRLLEKGAFIGPVIKNIRKSLLSDFLDSCITSNSRFHDDKEFELNVDFKFLKPSLNNSKPELHQININVDKSSVENLQKHHDEIHVPEMKPLYKLIESRNLQRLALHPVITSFVFLKWSKIRYLIHLNLVLTLMYIFSFIPFVLINEKRIFTDSNDKNSIYKALWVASFFSLTLLIIREISQLLLSPKRYILSRSNWVDSALILSSLAILLGLPSRNHQLRMLHTIVILLATWEYFNLLGYLPLLSVSLHTKIFRKVFTTFFKSLAFYSVMIIGFGLAFYTLQGNKFYKDIKYYRGKELDDSMVEIPRNNSRADRYNNFYTIRNSIVKSFVMLTGELDANSIHLEGNSYSALFLLFLFIVTIVLYNLLNALAVSDTQEIKVDAKLIDLQQRVITMHQSEEAIFNGLVGGHFQKIGLMLKKFISMFPNTIQNGEIFLHPNKNRYIYGNPDTKLKFNDDILNDMCTLLLKKRDERAAERKIKLKERTNEKLSREIIKMKEVIDKIQNRLDNRKN